MFAYAINERKPDVLSDIKLLQKGISVPCLEADLVGKDGIFL